MKWINLQASSQKKEEKMYNPLTVLKMEQNTSEFWNSKKEVEIKKKKTVTSYAGSVKLNFQLGRIQFCW